jgi:uncharacterized protein YprB with RNaseH-like and TPR domain
LPKILARHLDLFQEASKSIRLPIPQFGLKEIAAYFGIPRMSNIADGMEAEMKYHAYAREADPVRRQLLKDELVAYNREDLDSLIETMAGFDAFDQISGGLVEMFTGNERESVVASP